MNVYYRHCPICGRYAARFGFRHSCPVRVLAGIDAANTRAIRYEDALTDEYHIAPPPTWADRLKAGFRLMRLAGDI